MSSEPDSDDRFQEGFWNDEAAAARFSHPLHDDWLTFIVTTDSAILDFGCGYGRTVFELIDRGYVNVTGLDTSQAMLNRLRQVRPNVRTVHTRDVPGTLPGQSFDLVILFTVLTSIPDDASQRKVIQEVRRLLKPGGHAYVSDLPLQTDRRRMERYEQARPDGYPYGTFLIDDGRAVMRHHSEAWFRDLFSDFEIVDQRRLSVTTMRGRTGDAVQYLLRRPEA